MFNKVILVDGFDATRISVGKVLSELSILEIYDTKCCDDAYLKIKKGLLDNAPYDLLISDLSFKRDYEKNKLNSSEELITAVKKIQPNIKTIVFSEEDKSFRIKSLFNNFKISNYVYKGSNGLSELKKAIQLVFCEDISAPLTAISHALEDISLIEIEEYDVFVLKLMSFGYSSINIALDFKKSDVRPNSISSVEKRIAKLKKYFSARNNIHLIAIAKDLNIL